MNPKLLLINTLTLLYRESQLPQTDKRDTELLMAACTDVKTAVADLTVDKTGKMLHELKALAIEMINAPLGTEYDLAELLQKVQIICDPDPTLFEAFRDNILVELEPDEIKKTVIRIHRSFKKYFKEKEAKAVLSKYATKARYRPEEVGDISKFISELVTELEPYRSVDVEKDPAIISEINFDNLEEIAAAYEKVQEARNGETVLQTGWQGINKMLNGGVRLGETIVIGALQHNNKSGFSRSLFKHFCLYNKPFMFDEKKKPLLVLISFEDPQEIIMEWFYKSLKEGETGKFVSPEEISNTDPIEIARYVQGKLYANGFNIRIVHTNPSEWSYMDIQNKILSFEAEGFEVKALVIDYLAMIPTTGCTQGPNGVDLRDLFRRMRNFTAARKIALVTPHQLSTEAKLLVRQDTLDFVKKIANGGYYSGSRQIDQEVDTELYLHIEKVDGKSYQTIQRGKRRGTDITPEKDKYCVLPFQPIGGLLDDINGPDSSVPKPGAISKAAQDAGGEQPFWLDLDSI